MAQTLTEPTAEAATPTVADAPPRPPRWRRAVSSVRTRMLAWYVVLLAAALLVGVLAVRQVLLVRLDERVHADLLQEVEELRQLASGNDPDTGEPFRGDVERIFDVFLERNVPAADETFLTFVNGELYHHSAHTTGDALAPGPALTSLWATVTEPTRGRTATSVGEVDYVAVPLTQSVEQRGVFVAAIARDEERAMVHEVVRVASTVGAVTLLLASLLAWGAAGRVLSPVRMVTETARRTFEGNLGRRIGVRGSDEVAELAATFDAMLERLETAFATQRHFVDDAGHELRTPITIIRGHLELLNGDPQERRETVTIVTDELDRMSRMVDDLLVLAKAERPDFLTLEAVDVATLTTELRAKAGALADRDWRLEAIGEGTVVGDRQRITQAVMQLAQNAAQHTDPGAPITLGSAVGDTHVRFWVRDRGPGIPPEEHERVFERFARAANSRRRSHGAGLGLAIVRAIADAHHGSVVVSSTPGHGATFALRLPVDPTRKERRAA